MESAILVLHTILCMVLIGLILIQHGKGADAGAAFGSGASGTVFGATGSASFLTKLTTWVVIAFFATSLGLAYISANAEKVATSVFDEVQATEEAAPVAEDVPVVADDVPAVVEEAVEAEGDTPVVPE